MRKLYRFGLMKIYFTVASLRRSRGTHTFGRSTDKRPRSEKERAEHLNRLWQMVGTI